MDNNKNDVKLDSNGNILDKNGGVITDINRFETLYKYSYDQLNLSIERYERIDRKSSIYITMLSLIFVLLAFILQIEFKKFYPPSSFIDNIVYILILIILVLDILSIALLIRSIHFVTALYPSIDKEKLNNLYLNNNHISVLHASAMSFIETANFNFDTTTKKSSFVKLAHDVMNIILILLLFMFILFGTQLVINNPEIGVKDTIS